VSEYYRIEKNKNKKSRYDATIKHEKETAAFSTVCSVPVVTNLYSEIS